MPASRSFQDEHIEAAAQVGAATGRLPFEGRTALAEALRRLEDEGVIAGYTAVLDHARLGLPLQAFVLVSLDSHAEDVVARFQAALAQLEVDAAPKVTGKRGIQIWVPVAPGYTYAETRGWVERVSKAVGATVPELVSWEWTKDRRGGRARLDYTQNAINKTLVAPYSPRPAPGAPVSVPITWDELDDPDLFSATVEDLEQ